MTVSPAAPSAARASNLAVAERPRLGGRGHEAAVGRGGVAGALPRVAEREQDLGAQPRVAVHLAGALQQLGRVLVGQPARRLVRRPQRRPRGGRRVDQRARLEQVPRHLAGPARLRVERAREAPVQQRAAGGRQPGQHRLAHQRVREAVAAGHRGLVDQPGRDRRLERLGDDVVACVADGRDLGQREVLARDGRDVDRARSILRQPREPPADDRMHAGRHLGGRGRLEVGGARLDEVAHELLDEQRVTARAAADRCGELARRRLLEPFARQERHVVLRQPGQVDALEPPLAVQIAEQGVQAMGISLAQRAGDQQRRPAHGPDHVREHLHSGRIRPVQILEHEQHGPAARGVADRRRHRLEQPVAGVLRPPHRGLRLRPELRQQAGELGDHPVGQRGGRGVRAQRLGERRERDPAVLYAAAREHRRPGAVELAPELGQQTRLPRAGLAGDHHHSRGAGARPPPRGAKRGERVAPPHQGAVLGAGERVRQRRRAAVGLPGAELLEQRARVGRGRHPEVAPQRRAQVLVDRHRGRTVAAGRQPPHQHAGRLLRSRIELEPAARVAERRLLIAGGVAGGGQQLEHAVAVHAALIEHPVVVEIPQQVAIDERERLLEPSLGSQPLRLEHVDPDVRDAHPTAVGDDVPLGLPELTAQGGERGPQARAGAVLEDLGPEHGRHPRAWMQARVIRQPGDQRARAAARDRLERPASDIDAKLADQTDVQHADGNVLAARVPRDELRLGGVAARRRGGTNFGWVRRWGSRPCGEAGSLSVCTTEMARRRTDWARSPLRTSESR